MGKKMFLSLLLLILCSLVPSSDCIGGDLYTDPQPVPTPSIITYVFVTKWGNKGDEDGQFYCPTDISLDNSGNIYVTDHGNSRIQKFDSNGNFITKWGSEGSGDGQFKWPAGIIVDSKGNVYVTDYGNNCVQKFDSNGNFLTRWGTKDGKHEQLETPIAIAVDSEDFVFVADKGNRIQKFTPDGDFIMKWLVTGSSGAFYSVLDIAINSAGDVFTVFSEDIPTFDYNSYYDNTYITKYDSSGEFITKWGSKGHEATWDFEYSGEGQFNHAEGIATDSKGYIYVSDSGNNRIQKFAPNGTFITTWGFKGFGDGQFNRPRGIAIDRDGNVYVADSLNHRIQKFTQSPEFKSE